jgi:hypothetical protein
MVCSIELFDGVTNIDFKGLAFVEELKAEVPVFKLREPSPEEWNKRAREQNTKIFIQLHKRQPKDYNEVLAWINGNKENQCAGNTMAFTNLNNNHNESITHVISN